MYCTQAGNNIGVPRTANQKKVFEDVYKTAKTYFAKIIQTPEFKKATVGRFTRFLPTYCKFSEVFPVASFAKDNQQVIYKTVHEIFEKIFPDGTGAERFTQLIATILQAPATLCSMGGGAPEEGSQEETPEEGSQETPEEGSQEGSGEETPEEGSQEGSQEGSGEEEPEDADNRMVTVHFLFKHRPPTEPTPEVVDHVSVKVLDDNPMTVADLADYVVAQRSASYQGHVQFGAIMYPDPYEKVNTLYIENYDKPIFARTKRNTGGNIDFSRWMKDRKHIHVYAFKPTDPIVPVSKPGSRTIQLMYPGKRGETIYIRASLFDDIEDKASLKTFVTKNLQERISGIPGPYNDYANNAKITKLWYPDGTIFYDEAEINGRVRVKDHLSKGGFSDAKPLLIYNFNPMKKFPWASRRL